MDDITITSFVGSLFKQEYLGLLMTYTPHASLVAKEAVRGTHHISLLVLAALKAWTV